MTIWPLRLPERLLPDRKKLSEHLRYHGFLPKRCRLAARLLCNRRVGNWQANIIIIEDDMRGETVLQYEKKEVAIQTMTKFKFFVSRLTPPVEAAG